MAMPSVTAYEAQPQDRATEQPASGVRAKRTPQAAPAPQTAPARLHPDQEAMLLMMKMVERVEVARSFAKIAAGLLSVTASKASEQLRIAADAKMAEVIDRDGGLKSRYGRVLKVVKAAKDAAVHVAAHRNDTTERAAPSERGPETQDAPITQDPETQQAPDATAPHNHFD